MANFEVFVGNVGKVYSGKSELDARKAFREYEVKSLANIGRAGGESIVMLKDGEEYRIHETPEVIKNPSRRRSVAKNPTRRGEVDEQAANELALYANNEQNLYNLLQAFAKNYSLKMRKGTYNRERAVDGLEGMVGDVYRQYCKEFGRFPCNAATKRHAAEILLEGVEGDAEFMLKKNPSAAVKRLVSKIEKMVPKAKRAAKKAAPRAKKAAGAVKSHLLSLHSKLKKNPPNEAGGMAAFEHDVIGNPASQREIIKEYKERIKAIEAAEKAIKKVIAEEDRGEYAKAKKSRAAAQKALSAADVVAKKKTARTEAAKEKGRLLAAKHKAKKFATSARAEAARERGRLLAAKHREHGFEEYEQHDTKPLSRRK
jgi:hypothetical protein